MKTKIEKINGKNNLTVEYKGQVFIVKCAPQDCEYFKNNVDIMIKRFKDDLIGQKDNTSEQLEHDALLVTVKTQDVDRYFFKTTGTLQCSCNERCKVMDNGIMIGSVTCQNCKNCLEHDEPHPMTGTVDWIKCSKIKEATE